MFQNFNSSADSNSKGKLFHGNKYRYLLPYLLYIIPPQHCYHTWYQNVHPLQIQHCPHPHVSAHCPGKNWSHLCLLLPKHSNLNLPAPKIKLPNNDKITKV